ncbi:MAG: hypothetical protein CMM50_06815 [Rhodospirillaceae bacterium]|nr:hypothetical protein [Rhodospirillaceae bacterium]|tara:strand:- start:72 stop:377 length:306 start_codon:yes stop_codon:yes gene_type:complete
MTDETQPKRPSHYAYQVNEGQDGKSFFNKVGAAFAHKDGQGFNVLLDSVPVDGRVTLRTPQERLQDMRNEPQPQQQEQTQQQEQRQAEQQQPQQSTQGHER